jgi:hypothetical protein
MVLLVLPAFLLLVAVVTAIVRHKHPNPAATRTRHPLLRIAPYILATLIVTPIAMLIGFAGVAKRL